MSSAKADMVSRYGDSRTADRAHRLSKWFLALVMMIMGMGASAQSFSNLEKLFVFADQTYGRYGINWTYRLTTADTYTVVYDESSYAKLGELSDRLSTVEEALAKLMLNCAPTAANAVGVEAALTRLVRDMGLLPAETATSDHSVSATASEKRLAQIAFELSQLVGFLLDQQSDLLKVAYSGQFAQK